VSVEALFARSRPVEIAGAKAFTLDPLDRLLHLVTHLLRHAELGAAHEEALARWAVDAHAPVRLKWPLDIVSEIERRHAELEPRLLAARALEWNAAADLALGLGWIEQRLALTAPARAWVRSVLAPLPTPAPGSARSAARARERPLAGLDLRLSLLRSLPRWIWPEKSRFARRPDGRVPLLARLRHALTVGARVLALSFALPFAWLTRLARSVRPRALAPDELLELAVQARELERRGGSRAPSP
jgi:hypothetical protein